MLQLERIINRILFVIAGLIAFLTAAFVFHRLARKQ